MSKKRKVLLACFVFDSSKNVCDIIDELSEVAGKDGFTLYSSFNTKKDIVKLESIRDELNMILEDE